MKPKREAQKKEASRLGQLALDRNMNLVVKKPKHDVNVLGPIRSWDL